MVSSLSFHSSVEMVKWRTVHSVFTRNFNLHKIELVQSWVNVSGSTLQFAKEGKKRLNQSLYLEI